MRKAEVDETVRDSILGHASYGLDSRYNIIDIEGKQKAIRQLETYRGNLSVSKRVSNETSQTKKTLQLT